MAEPLPRYCGTPEPESLSQVSRPPRATWSLASDLPGLLHDALRAAVQAAFDAWSRVAGVSGAEAPAGAVADLLISCGPIDGPFGVLAETELPGPPAQRMLVDSAERWVARLGGGVPAQSIDVVRVLTHEVGHFWGLGHDLTPGSQALMAPTYNPAVDHPQPWDVQQMLSRYGPPAARPPTPPPTPAPPGRQAFEDVMVLLEPATRAEKARFGLVRLPPGA